MTFVKTTCSNCNKIYPRELRRVNEAKKYHWNQYCSLKCQKLAKNKQVTLKCGNSLCRKTIKRSPKEISASGICFCSRSCSAIVNNSKSPKRKPFVRKCKFCGKHFYSVTHRKYCSVKCYPHRQIFPKENIIAEIKQFYQKNGRIPLKREYHAYRTARYWFGTWNKAIKAAGLDPNPVLFSKKFIAQDGHNCDSLTEKFFDDWLFVKRVSHERNIPYPEGRFHFDFKVGSTYIEFFGLHGELRKYDELVRQKLKIIKKNNIKFLPIFPKNIYPKSNLEKILKSLLV